MASAWYTRPRNAWLRHDQDFFLGGEDADIKTLAQ
jgi:hypothetical protein